MADTNNKHDYHDPGLDRFEKSDASFKTIAIWMVVIIILAIGVAMAIWGYFNYFARTRMEEALAKRSPLLAVGQEAQSIPGPVLQLSPAGHMKQFLAEEDHALHNFTWVSKEAGVVRIPIELAIKKTLASGELKSRKQNPETTGTEAPEGARLPQDSSGGRTFWNLQTLK